MAFPLRETLRAGYNMAALSALVTSHVVRVSTRTLAAVPGDIWHSRCLANADKCHHGLPRHDDLDPEAVPPPCCPAVARLQARLAMA